MRSEKGLFEVPEQGIGEQVEGWEMKRSKENDRCIKRHNKMVIWENIGAHYFKQFHIIRLRFFIFFLRDFLI